MALSIFTYVLANLNTLGMSVSISRNKHNLNLTSDTESDNLHVLITLRESLVREHVQKNVPYIKCISVRLNMCLCNFC